LVSRNWHFSEPDQWNPSSIRGILRVLRELRGTVGDLVARAEQNHEAYNKKFEIRTEEIKEFWRNAQEILRKTSGRFKELETKHIVSLPSVAVMESKAPREMDAQQQVEQYAKSVLDGLVREVSQSARHEFDQWRNATRERLQRGGLQSIADTGMREELSGSTKTTISVGEPKGKFAENTQELSRRVSVGVAQTVLKTLSRCCKDFFYARKPHPFPGASRAALVKGAHHRCRKSLSPEVALVKRDRLRRQLAEPL
jgi:hypothetical protein